MFILIGIQVFKSEGIIAALCLGNVEGVPINQCRRQNYCWEQSEGERLISVKPQLLPHITCLPASSFEKWFRALVRHLAPVTSPQPEAIYLRTCYVAVAEKSKCSLRERVYHMSFQNKKAS